MVHVQFTICPNATSIWSKKKLLKEKSINTYMSAPHWTQPISLLGPFGASDVRWTPIERSKLPPVYLPAFVQCSF